MSKKALDNPKGYEHVLAAVDLLDVVVDDVFLLPEAAEARAIATLEKVGDKHGDDLLCGCWVASELAAALLQLLGRHIDAALLLAREHAAFATPVMTLARTVIEQGMRLAWLLGDADVRIRERRFFEFEKEERRLAKNLGRITEEHRQQWEQGLVEFLKDLPGEPQTGIPSTETLCQEYSESTMLYFAYRMFSQPIHGTASGASSFHVDTRLALEELGQGRGEWLDSEFVSLPLLAMWEAASSAMLAFRNLLAPEFECASLDKKGDFVSELKQIPPNIGWRAANAKAQVSDRLATKPSLNRFQRRRLAKITRQRSTRA